MFACILKVKRGISPGVIKSIKNALKPTYTWKNPHVRVARCVTTVIIIPAVCGGGRDWRKEGLGGLTEDKTGAAIRLLHTANFTFWTAYRERTLDFCSHDCRVEDAVRSALCSVRLCWSHAHDWLRPGEGKFKYTVVFTVKYYLRGVKQVSRLCWTKIVVFSTDGRKVVSRWLCYKCKMVCQSQGWHENGNCHADGYRGRRPWHQLL